MSESPTRLRPERLSREDVEQRVRRMLDHVLPDRGNDPCPPDLQELVAVLESRYSVRFSFLDDLGALPDGEEILGIFTVNPLTIRVTTSLAQWSPEFQKTLAHELGHLALHRDMIGPGKYISLEKPPEDTRKQLKYREMAELSDLGWVEWQANEFAMCLILPRPYLQGLIYAAQTQMGICHNLGTMYLDDQTCNRRDCCTIVARIADRSGAEPKLLWRRLRFLGILEDHRNSRSRPGFEALDAFFCSR